MAWAKMMNWLLRRKPAPADPAHYIGNNARSRIVAILRRNENVNDDEELAGALFECGELRQVKKGEDLIVEEGNDNDVYFLLFGETDILVDQKWIATRATPKQVGEMAALDPAKPRSATVRAKTETVFAWCVTAEDFNRLLASNPKARERIGRELSDRHREQLRRKASTKTVFDFLLWPALSIFAAVVISAIIWIATGFLFLTGVERVICTVTAAAVTFILMLRHNPAFVWRRLISIVLLGWIGLFLWDWTISGKFNMGGKETEISLTASGLNLDWTIVTLIAIVSIVLVVIFAVLEHKRMSAK